MKLHRRQKRQSEWYVLRITTINDKLRMVALLCSYIGHKRRLFLVYWWYLPRLSLLYFMLYWFDSIS
jgi:hypothetical protein